MTSIYFLSALLSIACYDVRADIYGFAKANNMVVNPGFGEELGSEWNVHKCDACSRAEEAAFRGSHGMLISNRTTKDGGVRQRLYYGAENPDLQPEKSFYLSARIKFLDNATEHTSPQWYITAKFIYKFSYDNKTYKVQDSAGRLMYEFADSTWNEIGGVIDSPPVMADGAIPNYLEFWIQVQPLEIDYYVDSFAVTRIEELGTGWKDTLQQKINDVRKQDIRMETTIPEDVNVTDTEIKVEWLGPEFHWGTGIQGNHLAGDSPFQLNLKQYILDTFNWIGFTAALQWFTMESEMDDWKFTPVGNSIDWLIANGIDVRGHTYLWEIMANNPVWAQSLLGTELKDKIMNRINTTGTYFKDKIYEWDVCNEFLHYHFFEERTGERSATLIAEEMEEAYAADPDARLCINDFGVLRDSQTTSNQANLAFKLRDHLQVPVGCVGAQGHIREADEFTLDKFRKRLEIISEPKLPVTISELSVHTSNVTLRAEILEKIMYAAFSQPEVEGVLYWGLSDVVGLRFEDDTALVEGANFTANEAGAVMEDLIRNTWTTPDYTLAPDNTTFADTRNVYNGKYRISTYVNNVLRETKTVSVKRNDTVQIINVDF